MGYIDTSSFTCKYDGYFEHADSQNVLKQASLSQFIRRLVGKFVIPRGVVGRSRDRPIGPQLE